MALSAYYSSPAGFEHDDEHVQRPAIRNDHWGHDMEWSSAGLPSEPVLERPSEAYLGDGEYDDGWSRRGPVSCSSHALTRAALSYHSRTPSSAPTPNGAASGDRRGAWDGPHSAQLSGRALGRHASLPDHHARRFYAGLERTSSGYGYPEPDSQASNRPYDPPTMIIDPPMAGQRRGMMRAERDWRLDMADREDSDSRLMTFAQKRDLQVTIPVGTLMHPQPMARARMSGSGGGPSRPAGMDGLDHARAAAIEEALQAQISAEFADTLMHESDGVSTTSPSVAGFSPGVLSPGGLSSGLITPGALSPAALSPAGRLSPGGLGRELDLGLNLEDSPYVSPGGSSHLSPSACYRGARRTPDNLSDCGSVSRSHSYVHSGASTPGQGCSPCFSTVSSGSGPYSPSGYDLGVPETLSLPPSAMHRGRSYETLPRYTQSLTVPDVPEYRRSCPQIGARSWPDPGHDEPFEAPMLNTLMFRPLSARNGGARSPEVTSPHGSGIMRTSSGHELATSPSARNFSGEGFQHEGMAASGPDSASGSGASGSKRKGSRLGDADRENNRQREQSKSPRPSLTSAPKNAKEANNLRHPIDWKTLSLLFDESLSSAAKKLSVSPTTLKKMCRLNGIEKWPYRKLRMVEDNIKRLEALAAQLPTRNEDLFAKIEAERQKEQAYRAAPGAALPEDGNDQDDSE